MTRASVFLYVNRFAGEPKVSDFKLISEQLQPLQENEVLVKADYLSVDPYMRVYMDRYALGTQMIGAQIATVLESRCDRFRVGDHIYGSFGWRTHTVFNPDKRTDMIKVFVLPSLGRHSLSLGIGAIGMTGCTAYFGLLEICRPKDGEVLVVSGAGGAVGSVVGQIGKIKGCRVIGVAGSDAKCKWLTEELGFDVAINYKTEVVADALRKAAPRGVDCYFDNVGGEMSSTIVHQMNTRGRVSCCGSISSYNDAPENWPKVPLLQPSLVFKEILMEGFMVYRWADRWLEAVGQLLDWVNEGKLKHQETITEGFENMPKAFIEMLRGDSTGKAVVKV